MSSVTTCRVDMDNAYHDRTSRRGQIIMADMHMFSMYVLVVGYRVGEQHIKCHLQVLKLAAPARRAHRAGRVHCHAL